MLKIFYFFYLIAITDVMKPQEYPIISHFLTTVHTEVNTPIQYF